jgi:ethanolamine ammonia-lyase large subunit
MDTQRLRQTLVLANSFKEGDLLVGGTTDDATRESARAALRATRLADIRTATLVDDGVSDALARSVDRSLQAELDSLTIAAVAERLLAPDALQWARRYRAGLSSESIAAVAKVLTNTELGVVARTLFNPLAGEGVTVGSPHHFGSRIQPNSPGDDEDEILFSVLEGLSYGCGDVIIGLNPASDDLDTIVRLEQLLQRIVQRLEVPTRYCVLSDLVKQHKALDRTAVDVGFQSLAGTSRALTGMVGLDVDGILDLSRSFGGLYFETGQGSAVTNGTAEGVDMVTLEARAYGVARYIGQQTGTWMIVNDVAGFIGPEVFRTPEQLERACLEDIVMAKLHGLTMGLDVCATFHMGISPRALRDLTTRIVARAAPAYLMAVAGNADPMLGYLTTSFREHPHLQQHTRKRPTSSMMRRLGQLGVVRSDGAIAPTADSTARLYATFAKAGGATGTAVSLETEARQKLKAFRERGYDLGYSTEHDESALRAAEARVDNIYEHARTALYATLDPAVIGTAVPSRRWVHSKAFDRDDYLAHPYHGEHLRLEDIALVAGLYPSVPPPPVQIVISDGLNAHAINEHLPTLLPQVLRSLREAGIATSATQVVIENGRVRVGYHVGQLIDATVIVHFIGERPGTRLNTVSAYITYGRDQIGRSCWSPDLDHSWTTAICGIHPSGTPPVVAASQIARVVERALATRRSGVAVARGI